MSIAIKIIEFYQKFISPLFGSNCRYYPTCSEYSKWVFQNQNVFIAFLKTILRILRCNQLFAGGIDYPKIKFKPKKVSYGKKVDILYFLIPYKKDIYFLVKRLKD